jgi:soluble lytic murein transglycosylase-like protein
MFETLASQVAAKEQVPANLLIAIMKVESNCNPFVVRMENEWKYLVNPSYYAEKNGITLTTEIHLQSMSWGLCQVMGSVAREFGFEDMLTQLVDPAQSLTIGARLLHKLFIKYPNQNDVIVSYNAGSPRHHPDGLYVNQDYLNKVNTLIS